MRNGSYQVLGKLNAAQIAELQIAATSGQPTQLYDISAEFFYGRQESFVKPRARILDSDFEYVHSSRTDITKTWRKFGWVPLGEQK